MFLRILKWGWFTIKDPCDPVATTLACPQASLTNFMKETLLIKATSQGDFTRRLLSLTQVRLVSLTIKAKALTSLPCPCATFMERSGSPKTSGQTVCPGEGLLPVLAGWQASAFQSPVHKLSVWAFYRPLTYPIPLYPSPRTTPAKCATHTHAHQGLCISCITALQVTWNVPGQSQNNHLLMSNPSFTSQ